ncbi:thyrotropin-releasing hormone receptor-like isoform X2 [Convolutriloba macropyga]
MIYTCEKFIDSFTFWQIWLYWTKVGVLSLGSILNLFVLFILLLGYPKTATDIYLISITVGDVTICGASVLNGFMPEELQGIWVAALAEILGNLGLFAVITTILAFTVERYRAIQDPFANLQGCGRGKSIKIVCGMWAVLTVYCVLGVLFVLDFEAADERDPFHPKRFIGMFYLNFVLFYLIPVVATLVLYTLILRVVKKRNAEIIQILAKDRAIIRNRISTSSFVTSIGGCDSTTRYNQSDRGREAADKWKNEAKSKYVPPSQGTDRLRVYGPKGSSALDAAASIDMQRLKKFKQMINLFILLLISFLALMSPYRLLNMCLSIMHNLLGIYPSGWTGYRLDMGLWASSTVFAANSIVNPILFNVLSSRFRMKLHKFFALILKKFKCMNGRDARRLNTDTSVNNNNNNNMNKLQKTPAVQGYQISSTIHRIENC